MNTNPILQKGKETVIQSAENTGMDAVSHFFPEELYEMLHSTHDFTGDTRRYVRTSPDPGFQFEIRISKIRFWVECKYRENRTDSETIRVFNEGQLDMYKSVENSFLFFSSTFHGETCQYLIPVHHIPGDELSFSFIEPYRLNYGLGVRTGMIQKYLRLENTNPVIRF